MPHNKKMHPNGNKVASSLRSSTSTPRRVILVVLSTHYRTALTPPLCSRTEALMRTSMSAIAVTLVLTVLAIADDRPARDAPESPREAASAESHDKVLRKRIAELEKRVAALEARIIAAPAYPPAHVAPQAPAPYATPVPPTPYQPAPPRDRHSAPVPPKNDAVPDTWQRFEFNGQYFYIVPADKIRPQTTRRP